MTIFVDASLRLMPAGVKDFLLRKATPRVVERDRGRRETVASRINMFVAAIERHVRDADVRVARLLDSEDVRLAITDLRTRGGHLASALRLDLIGVDALLAFIASVEDLGVGGVKAARTSEEVADAASRAIDHLEGYLVAHAHLTVPDAPYYPVRPDAAEVRKLSACVTERDVSAWAAANLSRVRETLTYVELGGGDTRLA